MSGPTYRLVRKKGPTGTYLTTEPANAAARRKDKEGMGEPMAAQEVVKRVRSELRTWEQKYAVTNCSYCFGVTSVIGDITKTPIPCPHCNGGGSGDPTRLAYWTTRMMDLMRSLQEFM